MNQLESQPTLHKKHRQAKQQKIQPHQAQAEKKKEASPPIVEDAQSPQAQNREERTNRKQFINDLKTALFKWDHEKKQMRIPNPLNYAKLEQNRGREEAKLDSKHHRKIDTPNKRGGRGDRSRAARGKEYGISLLDEPKAYKEEKREVILLKQFKITHKITQGSFGQVYIGKDTKTGKGVICKINKEHKMNKHEYDILKLLNEKGYSTFPEALGIGDFEGQPFQIQERLGKTLEYYQQDRKSAFSFKTVQMIGMKIVGLLEQVHSIGFVYNDLKPDNILIGRDQTQNDLHKFFLIDFGLATPFLQKNKATGEYEHIEMKKAQFQGNLAFSSYNAFNNKSLSRRDDLISMIYLLTYLASGKLPFVNTNIPLKEQVQAIREKKNTQLPEQFCNSSKCKSLIPIANMIYQIKFEQAPDYEKLKLMFLQNLLNEDMVPNKEFDWNIPFLVDEIMKEDEKYNRTNKRLKQIGLDKNYVKNLKLKRLEKQLNMGKADGAARGAAPQSLRSRLRSQLQQDGGKAPEGTGGSISSESFKISESNLNEYYEAPDNLQSYESLKKKDGSSNEQREDNSQIPEEREVIDEDREEDSAPEEGLNEKSLMNRNLGKQTALDLQNQINSDARKGKPGGNQTFQNRRRSKINKQPPETMSANEKSRHKQTFKFAGEGKGISQVKSDLEASLQENPFDLLKRSSEVAQCPKRELFIEEKIQGYRFKHHRNQKAMKKVLKVSPGSHKKTQSLANPTNQPLLGGGVGMQYMHQSLGLQEYQRQVMLLQNQLRETLFAQLQLESSGGDESKRSCYQKKIEQTWSQLSQLHQQFAYPQMSDMLLHQVAMQGQPSSQRMQGLPGGDPKQPADLTQLLQQIQQIYEIREMNMLFAAQQGLNYQQMNQLFMGQPQSQFRQFQQPMMPANFMPATGFIQQVQNPNYSQKDSMQSSNGFQAELGNSPPKNWEMGDNSPNQYLLNNIMGKAPVSQQYNPMMFMGRPGMAQQPLISYPEQEEGSNHQKDSPINSILIRGKIGAPKQSAAMPHVPGGGQQRSHSNMSRISDNAFHYYQDATLLGEEAEKLFNSQYKGKMLGHDAAYKQANVSALRLGRYEEQRNHRNSESSLHESFSGVRNYSPPSKKVHSRERTGFQNGSPTGFLAQIDEQPSMLKKTKTNPPILKRIIKQQKDEEQQYQFRIKPEQSEMSPLSNPFLHGLPFMKGESKSPEPRRLNQVNQLPAFGLPVPKVVDENQLSSNSEDQQTPQLNTITPIEFGEGQYSPPAAQKRKPSDDQKGMVYNPFYDEMPQPIRHQYTIKPHQAKKWEQHCRPKVDSKSRSRQSSNAERRSESFRLRKPIG